MNLYRKRITSNAYLRLLCQLSFLFIIGFQYSTNPKTIQYIGKKKKTLYKFFISANTMHMKNNFIKCGITGWCLEVLFTGIHSLIQKDFRLMSQTSILMFPIYGAAAFLRPIYRLTKNRNILFRGGIYTCCIFLTEYISGSLLKKKGICPWDYSGTPLNIGGLIRLDYAPFWFGAGLLFERMIK